jgi:SAM-dependent methyltransferase
MDRVKEALKRYYEEWWENPKDPRSVIFDKLNKIVSERLPNGIGKKALDVGAGKGKIVSFLLQKGYKVTAVELNENFVANLKQRFPDIEVINGDFNSISINRRFDLVTAIEFIQNLDEEKLINFLKKVSTLTDNLIFNISNRHSLHGFWVALRHFQNPFVYTYTPEEIEAIVKSIRFEISYQKGIGLITPITLLREFKFKLIPSWLAKGVNLIGDPIFPKMCHLYYFELKKKGRCNDEDSSDRG